MKIRPIILCGGAGTRLWLKTKNNEAKQFINFGGWTLLEKTLNRIKNPIYDYPIISTNYKYLKQVREHLRLTKIKKYKIVLEPAKRNFYLNSILRVRFIILNGQRAVVITISDTLLTHRNPSQAFGQEVP